MSDHVTPKTTQLTVYIALMLLLALTVGLSMIPMHGYEALPAYAIAIAKALLVVLFFMEARHSSRVAWLVIGGAVLWLGILLVLTTSDYVTRGWTPSGEVISPMRSPIIAPEKPTNFEHRPLELSPPGENR